MIALLKEKLHVNNYYSPNYQVGDKTFYSKHYALEHCRKIGWEWPTFRVWGEAQSFARPKLDFDKSVQRQCELISDTSQKVRLWYSGGRDSNLILHRFLDHGSKLDEIAIYRRFPGKIDDDSNEWDQFGLLKATKKLLIEKGRHVPIVHYDLLPEHFNYYSSRLDSLYFPYSELDFFVNGVHSIAEFYPEILDNGFVNVMGHAFPYVNNNNEFYWIDGGFNLTQNDPYVVNFFCDPRNTDLAVNIAYTMRDYLQSHGKTSNEINWVNGEYKNFKPVRDILGFPNTGTLLDTKYDALTTNGWSQWHLGRKQLVYMGNCQKSEIGRNTFDNFAKFYFDYQKQHSKYFQNNNIFDRWIGSVSEKHVLK